MRVVIVGAGYTGTQLAKYLINEKHDVSIIEASEDRARSVSNRLDCMVINDRGNNIKALRDTGISEANALVCVTGSDEMNMVICGIAASLCTEEGKLIKIAKVRNEDYIHLNSDNGKKVLDIDYFIHPGIEVARSIIKAIEHGVIGAVLSFSDTPYELGAIDISAGSGLDGISLFDYRKLVKYESLVTLVERGDDVILPSGSTVLKSGDHVHILADTDNLPEIYKLAGDNQKPINKIGIAGGGKIGSLIAEGLLNTDSIINQDDKNINQPKKSIILSAFSRIFKNKNRHVVIIEQDSALCRELAVRFPSALILNEDISDESFVNEEGLDNLDCLIAANVNEELNIITSIFMKSRGIPRTIALVTGSGHAAMARHLGVDVVIPIQHVMVDSILTKLMGSGIKEVRSLGDGNVELIEIEIGSNAPVIDKPISTFKLSAGGLVLLVSREGESFIPKGDYVFKEGDRIVLIARFGSQAEIEKYFNTDK
ncbi:MAG: NAD-binding protein [Treponema sp.]|jgi:trk system potassium uptake protein TrkA|nr:NAD-binding protein [Treponema sp.]